MQIAKRDRLTMGEKDGGTGDRRLGQIVLEREYLKLLFFILWGELSLISLVMLPEKWVKFSNFRREISRAVTPWQWLASVSHLRSAVVISSTASLVLKRLSSLARWVAVSRDWSPDDTHDCVCV